MSAERPSESARAPEPPGGSPRTPAVAVVVPTRDRPAALRRCLAALAAQDLGRPPEVVVVDDGSRDRGAVEAAVASLPGARLVRTPGRGPATARNAGARAAGAAGAEVVCFTDDDCEPAPQWARLLAAAALASAAGIAAGRTVTVPGAPAAVVASQAITNHLQREALSAAGELSFAPTCNLACRRAVIGRLPFDATYPSAAGEDREWWAQATAAGLAGRYEPRAVVVHRPDLGLRGFLAQQFRYGRGAARFRGRARGADDGWRRLAPPRFYARLVRRGFAAGPAAGGLVLAAQVATAAGIAAERLAGR